MALTLPGHSAPAVGFEVPLEMLAACHGRVQHQCETLLRLVTHLQTHGADRPAQEAASAVMRYFDTAARHHHEDEEQDLFPALLESMAGSDAVCLRDLRNR
jgi:iron-sulfur cluster repair protein YtfE (RIC family)